MTTVPRGWVIEIAARKPSAEPVASTTIGNARAGSFSRMISVEMPALSAILSLLR